MVSHKIVEQHSAGRYRDAFLRWQCRVRQIVVRDKGGMPDVAVTPELIVDGKQVLRVVTVLSKSSSYSQLPEIRHMAQRSQDPAERRESALRFFSAAYYQKAREFSDNLTVTFPRSSVVITGEKCCRMVFSAYAQRFDFFCKIKALDKSDYLYQTTWWHNFLFNPNLRDDVTILAFAPDWSDCVAAPDVLGA